MLQEYNLKGLGSLFVGWEVLLQTVCVGLDNSRTQPTANTDIQLRLSKDD